MSAETTLLDAGWSRPSAVPDLSGDDPVARFAAAAASPWVGLVIPTDLSGLGGSILDAASAQRTMARTDPSAAIALNMHVFTVGLMVEYWERHRDTSWMLLEGIAGSGGLVASAFAEPGGSPNFLATASRAEPTDGGWLVTGRKMPCSLAASARLFCLTAADSTTGNTIVALCPAESPGIFIEDPWPSIGMRGSDTGAVRFESVFVDRRLVFHQAPPNEADDLVVAGLVWFNALAAASYHGLLTELVALAAARAGRGSGRAEGWADALLGRATQDVYLLGAAVQRLACLWASRDLPDQVALAASLALRAQTADVRDRVVHGLTPLLGSQVFVAGTPAGQLALDSLAAPHHPPGRALCDLELGRHIRHHRIDLEAS